MTDTPKKKGQRGPDKKPRTHGGGMPPKAEADKATCRNVAMLTPAQDADVQRLFGTAKQAVIWAIENYPTEKPAI